LTQKSPNSDRSLCPNEAFGIFLESSLFQDNLLLMRGRWLGVYFFIQHDGNFHILSEMSSNKDGERERARISPDPLWNINQLSHSSGSAYRVHVHVISFLILPYSAHLTCGSW